MHFFWPSSLSQKVTDCAFDLHHAVPKPHTDIVVFAHPTGGGAHRVAASHSFSQIFFFFLQPFCDESFLHSFHLVLHSPITGLGCRCEFITEASSSEVGREVASGPPVARVTFVAAVAAGAAAAASSTAAAGRVAASGPPPRPVAPVAPVAAAAAARAAVC